MQGKISPKERRNFFYSKGWCNSETQKNKKNTDFFVKTSEGDKFFELMVSYRYSVGILYIDITVNYGLKSVSEFFLELINLYYENSGMGRKKNLDGLYIKNIGGKVESTENFDNEITFMLGQIDTWSKSLDLDSKFEEHCSSQGAPADQWWHLACLISKCDYNTLIDYQQEIASGSTAGLSSDIDKNIIDKAVSMAIDRVT